jgi:TPR repeat protein
VLADALWWWDLGCDEGKILVVTRRRLWLGLAVIALISVVVARHADAVRAPLLALACRVGSGTACVKAARIYSHPDSTALLARGCERLAHPDSCTMLADYIAVGLAGPPDFARAEEMCFEGDRRFLGACMVMAELTIEGQFGDYERQKRAETFFKRACQLGSDEGCRRVAGAAARIARARRVAAIFEACSVRGDPEACAQMDDEVHRMVDALRRTSGD